MLNKNTGLLFLLFFFSFCVQAQHPVVQRVIDKDPQLIVERQQNENSYIVAIAIDKHTRTSYLVSRYGFIADSVVVSPADLQLITEKKVSAFAHYQALIAKMTEIAQTARQQIRKSGSLDKNWTFAPVISNMVPELDTTKGHLQKLLLLDNFAREFYISSFLATHLKTKSGAAEEDSLPGAPGTFQHLGDSTVYFNSNLLAEQQKAVMYPNKNILIFYNINNEAADTVTVSNPVQARLERQKTDVFLLYRGWLETQKIAIEEKRKLLADVAQKPVLQLAVNKNAKLAVLKVLAENKQEAEEVEQKLNKVSRPGSGNITRLLEQQTQYVPENRFLLESLGMGYTTQFNRGTKKYELTDHRGNVMGVVTDRKLPVDAGTYNLQCYPCFPGLPCPPCEYVLTNPNPDGITDYFTADIAQVTDYFPFGMSMPGRKFNSGAAHRFGFQAQEVDPEIWNGGISYKYRIEDARLGRFFSTDPLQKDYPANSPFAFSENIVINAVELEGLESASLSGSLSANLDISSLKRGRFSGSFGGNLSFNLRPPASSVSGAANLAGSLSFGGLGTSATSQQTHLNLSLSVAASISLSSNNSPSSPQNFQTVSSGMPSQMTLNYKSSLNLAYNFIYNPSSERSPNLQHTGTFGFKVGDFSAHHSNDALSFRPTDHYYGSLLAVNIGNNNNVNFAYTSEEFNGQRLLSGLKNKDKFENPGATDLPVKDMTLFGKTKQVSYASQTPFDRTLNRGMNLARLNIPTRGVGGNVTGYTQLRVFTSGGGVANTYKQTILHFFKTEKGYKQFDYSSEREVGIGVGVNR